MSSPTPVTLSAHGLSRHFGGREVIHNVSLELGRGEVLGLLGHNGAGKSTTLQMLAGALSPHSGKVSICGFDLARQPREAKARIGYLPEAPPLYRDMSVDSYLQFAARLRGIPQNRVTAALTEAKRRCNLQDAGKKIIATLSKGYQQRVGIAQAIIHEPDVIVLDEPTVGLDPAQIRDIRALIRELGDKHSVILSTHLLSEVENICDRVEIMHLGRLIYGDSSDRIQQYRHQPGFIVTLLAPPELSELHALEGVEDVEPLSATQFRILHQADTNPGAALLELAAQHGWRAEQLVPLQSSLEDVFIKITRDETK